MTGKNNCLFDAIAQGLTEMGKETSTQKLRDIISEWSWYGIAIGASELLNNNGTQNIYLKAIKGLLVGGKKPYVKSIDFDDSSDCVDCYKIPMKYPTPIKISQRNDDHGTKGVTYTKGPEEEPTGKYSIESY